MRAHHATAKPLSIGTERATARFCLWRAGHWIPVHNRRGDPVAFFAIPAYNIGYFLTLFGVLATGLRLAPPLPVRPSLAFCSSLLPPV